MNGIDLKGLKVIVVGAGRSGVGAARLLARAGAVVTVNDVKSRDSAEIDELRAGGVNFVFGGHPRTLFESADLVVLSPGVPRTTEPLGELDIPVLGELELGSRFLSAPVVAITGTNGKSTVTHLVYETARIAGRDAALCGNVGTAVSQVLWERGVEGPDSGRQPGLAVVEVSSFQLETIVRFRPAVAVVLNVTPDHMDRYASPEEYRAAKERIFENQRPGDVTVLNADDPVVAAMATRTRGEVWWFSRRRPVGPGVFVSDDGRIVWSMPGGQRAEICRSSELRIRGLHNLENACAAAAASLASGCAVEDVAQSLRSFPGLPHRMEFVLERGGVTWVNDSKGTNVDAMMRSLESVEGRVLLIAGGRDKHGDFPAAAGLVNEKVSHLILIGEAAGVIEESLGNNPDIVYRAETLNRAVAYAAEHARPGDTVLLSPGCASFDQFADFEDRGRQFRKAVEDLFGA